MANDPRITRTADRVTNFIEEYVTLVGADKREEVFALFDTILQVFPHWGIMTCPVMHPTIRYVSENCEYIFGRDKEYFTLNSNMKTYYSFIHADNLEDVFKCFDYVHNFLQDIDPLEHQKYRCVFHYRFRKSDGQYFYLHDEKVVIHLKESGNLYYCLFRDITSERTFNGVKVEIFKNENGSVKIAEYKPASENAPLTKRESELVALIKQGLTTKEIAWYLKISHNTVRNIKSKLFEKYNVNNTVELLNITA